jgi:hypothetical protein
MALKYFFAGRIKCGAVPFGLARRAPGHDNFHPPYKVAVDRRRKTSNDMIVEVAAKEEKTSPRHSCRKECTRIEMLESLDPRPRREDARCI